MSASIRKVLGLLGLAALGLFGGTLVSTQEASASMTCEDNSCLGLSCIYLQGYECSITQGGSCVTDGCL